MKKNLFAILIGLMPTLLMAQPLALNNKTSLPPNASVASTNNDANPAKATRRAARESKQFNKTTKAFSADFKNASDVQWTSDKINFVGTFTKVGTRNMVWYGKNGQLLYTMLTYSSDKLPKAERRIMEDEFGDYKITLVDEVHQGDTIVYVVHLENDHHIKLVTVCNGETNIYQDYKKI